MYQTVRAEFQRGRVLNIASYYPARLEKPLPLQELCELFQQNYRRPVLTTIPNVAIALSDVDVSFAGVSFDVGRNVLERGSVGAFDYAVVALSRAGDWLIPWEAHLYLEHCELGDAIWICASMTREGRISSNLTVIALPERIPGIGAHLPPPCCRDRFDWFVRHWLVQHWLVSDYGLAADV